VGAAQTLPRPTLLELSIAGPIDPWLELGFSDDPDTNSIRIGTTTLRFDTPDAPPAIVAWTLDPDPGVIDGLKSSPYCIESADGAQEPQRHTNSATTIDHVVIMTPDIDRTDRRLAAAGFDRRRVRQAGTPERPLWQSFYRLGEVVLEVVGPKPARDQGLASFWGLVVVVEDLEEMASANRGRIGRIKDAVQPGRRIATVEKSARLGIPTAFMNPEVR